MTPTIPYIQSCFDEFNARFFASSLPPIPIKLSNARTFLGKVTFTRRRSWLFGPVRNENFVLRINTRIDLPEDLIQDTILHEMIRYYIAVNQLRDTSSHIISRSISFATPPPTAGSSAARWRASMPMVTDI